MPDVYVEASIAYMDGYAKGFANDNFSRAWQTLRPVVLAQQTNNSAMDAISLAEEHGLLYPYDSTARQQMFDHAQWLRAKLHHRRVT